MKRLAFPILLILLILAILDFLKLVERNAPQPRQYRYGADRKPRTRRIIESAEPITPEAAARIIREYQPRGDVTIIPPGAPEAFREAAPDAELPPADETRAERYKRESNERLQARFDARQAVRATKRAAGE